MNYRLFGSTGLRVSELCLGTMTFGEEWGTGANYETSKKIFDQYAAAGGNFIDTANRYTEGTSERWLGEFIAHDRDRFVLATKYTLYDRRDDVNASGNHRKNLMRSVNESLNRMQTDYIDLLWLHMWDFTTPVEEVMRGLDDLIRMGVVHYIGISDTPAWLVAKANTMADLRNWTAFAGLQVEYSLIQRTAERDLIPMARHYGMAITPWAPLGAGLLTGKHNESPADGARLKANSVKMSDNNLGIARKLSELASQMGCTPSQLALAWIRSKGSDMLPIVGSRSEQQIIDTLACIHVNPEPEVLAALDEVSAIEYGFPHDFYKTPGVQSVIYADSRESFTQRRY